MLNIEAQGSMVDEQGGGCHSCSAIHGAHKKVLSYDIIQMNHLLARNIDNDPSLLKHLLPLAILSNHPCQSSCQHFLSQLTVTGDPVHN